MPFALPGQTMPDHIGRKKRRLETSWGYAPYSGEYRPPDVTLDVPGGSASQAQALDNGIYDVRINGPVASEKRRIVVTTGSYTVTPATGDTVFTQALFYGPYQIAAKATGLGPLLQAGTFLNSRGGVNVGCDPSVSEMIIATTATTTNMNASGLTPVHQGVATDETSFGRIHTDRIDIVASDWLTIVATNTTPFAGLPSGVNHCGDGCMVAGKLYVPIEAYNGVSYTGTLNQVVRFNGTTGAFEATFDVAAIMATDPLAGIAYAPLTNTWWGVVYKVAAVPRLIEFNADWTLKRSINLPWALRYQMGQGLDVQPATGRLAIAAQDANGVRRIVVCGTDGALLYTLSVGDVVTRGQEGICFRANGELAMLDNLGTTDAESYVRQIAMPSDPTVGFTKEGFYTGQISGRRSLRLELERPGNEWTLYMRAKSVTRTASRALWDNGRAGNTANLKGVVDSAGALTGRGAAAGAISYSAALAANQRFTYSFGYNHTSGAKKLFADNAERATGTDGVPVAFPATGEFCLGGEGYSTNQPGNTYYGFAALFTRQLTEAEQQSVDADLSVLFDILNAYPNA